MSACPYPARKVTAIGSLSIAESRISLANLARIVVTFSGTDRLARDSR